MFFSKSKNVVGLDIGSSAVKLVYIEAGTGTRVRLSVDEPREVHEGTAVGAGVVDDTVFGNERRYDRQRPEVDYAGYWRAWVSRRNVGTMAHTDRTVVVGSLGGSGKTFLAKKWLFRSTGGSMFFLEMPPMVIAGPAVRDRRKVTRESYLSNMPVFTGLRSRRKPPFPYRPICDCQRHSQWSRDRRPIGLEIKHATIVSCQRLQPGRSEVGGRLIKSDSVREGQAVPGKLKGHIELAPDVIDSAAVHLAGPMRHWGTLIKTRNIGIMAHIDSGLSPTTERILYYTGSTYQGELERADIGDLVQMHVNKGEKIKEATVGFHGQTRRVKSQLARPETITRPWQATRRRIDLAVSIAHKNMPPLVRKATPRIPASRVSSISSSREDGLR